MDKNIKDTVIINGVIIANIASMARYVTSNALSKISNQSKGADIIPTNDINNENLVVMTTNAIKIRE